MEKEERAKRRKELLLAMRNKRTKTLRSQIMMNSPYSQELTPYIRNLQELDFYLKSQLKEAFITRPCLVAAISFDTVYTKTGETNDSRMMDGRPPCAEDGVTLYHLHHIGQTFGSPFAELPESAHNAPGIDRILHNKKAESWRKDPALVSQFARQKELYWMERRKLGKRVFGNEKEEL